MKNHYSTWLALLSAHEALLVELKLNLDEERKALLANDLVPLKESSLRKEHTLLQLLNFQKKFLAFKEQVAREFGLKTPSLNAIFNAYEGEERNTLQFKRDHLTRLSKTVTRLNQFNAKCLGTYLEHVGVLQTVFNLATGQNQTYTAGGHQSAGKTSGRLVSRSF